MGLCYDIEGNTVDCGGSDVAGYSSGVSSTDIGAGLDFSNPVASQANNPNGQTSILDRILNFSQPILQKVIPGQSTQSNLRLQVNPATGQYQYFNPSTNQYVGSPVNQSNSLFSGNSLLLVLAAVLVAFLIYNKK